MTGDQGRTLIGLVPPYEEQRLPLHRAGSPSQRTGCWTVRTVTTWAHGTVWVWKKATRRRPCALTHVPIRSSRSAAPMMSSAMRPHTAPPPRPPVKAMITAANMTYEASSRSSAANPTRHGPGR